VVETARPVDAAVSRAGRNRAVHHVEDLFVVQIAYVEDVVTVLKELSTMLPTCSITVTSSRSVCVPDCGYGSVTVTRTLTLSASWPVTVAITFSAGLALVFASSMMSSSSV